MAHFTSNTYTLKREILTFSNKISKKLSKPDKKFTRVFDSSITQKVSIGRIKPVFFCQIFCCNI